MNPHVEISAALPGRPRWQLVGFAAGCAQRLMPVVASLGGSSLAGAAEAGVALAWRAAEGHDVQPEIQQAIVELTLALEDAADDPRRPDGLWLRMRSTSPSSHSRPPQVLLRQIGLRRPVGARWTLLERWRSPWRSCRLQPR